MQAAVVGAGIVGRLIALKLLESGYDVELYERRSFDSSNCSMVAAGMLSPYTELDSCELEISDLGLRSIKLWRDLLANLDEDIFFQEAGSLVLAHYSDRQELSRYKKLLEASLVDKSIIEVLRTETISQLEPEIDFAQALYIKDEAQIDTRAVMNALLNKLHKLGAKLQQNTEVGLDLKADLIVDTRGLATRQGLRGVRGEIIRLHATEVQLNRPIRLLHPRHPIYIVPRPNNEYLIGATSIETEDYRPITVQSSLELLSTACTVHPGFAEASIIETNVECRPAYPGNNPKIQMNKNILSINGLYRHGYLIAPALVEDAMIIVKQGVYQCA